MSFGIVGTDVMERINWVRLRKEKKEKAIENDTRKINID